MDIDGNVVDNRFEKFKPEVTRRDLSLDGSLGDNADNFPREVFAVKKVLSKAGAFTFAPGIEPTTVPNARFKTAIQNFQAANDLKVDGLIRSGGPTIHMLGRAAIGQADGRPSGYDAADYEQNTGRDPNLTPTGKAIFKTLGEGGGAGTSETQLAGKLDLFRRRRSGSGGAKREKKSKIQRKIEDFIEKQLSKPGGSKPKKGAKERIEPEIGKTPVTIFKYSDGRVYLSITPLGEIQLNRRKPGKIRIEEIKNRDWLEGIISSSKQPYPEWDDRQSFKERNAAGQESYVYGPARDKDGNVSYKPLIDPSTTGPFDKPSLLRAPVGKPIYLTLQQIKAMGLRKWHVVGK